MPRKRAGAAPTRVRPGSTSTRNHAAGALPPITLRTYALAAVATLSRAAGVPSEDMPEVTFLLHHLAAVAPGKQGWASTLLSYLHNPAPEDTPLLQLGGELGLSVPEMLAVALAAAVEDDPLAGRALAHVQAPVGGSRPTLGLLDAALGVTVVGGARPIDVLTTGPALHSGLLRLLHDGAPLPERALQVPVAVCLALRGYDGTWPGALIGLEAAAQVTLPPSILAEAQRHAAGLLAHPHRTLVIRSGSLAEGKAVADAIARVMGNRPLFIEGEAIDGLAPWVLLRQLLPVFRLELGPGERKLLPSIPLYPGPSLALAGPDGSVEAPGGAALSWSLPVPPVEERRQLWYAALHDEALATALAQHHRHSSGRIVQLGRLARHRSALQGRSQPAHEDVIAASRAGEGIGLDSLAQSLPEAIPDAALVLPPGLRREMDILLLRCLTRDRLAEGLGASTAARYHPGVRVLFVGPSGTGKTLAAGWLATRLGLPLYRVDLASVTSKYIGETEKNLAQLLARAEQAEVVLLFDEADSLFGKRTDVKEANDRFANAQTNYLLQRIESFDGITLLTSNSRSRFDSAFSRRLDMVIEFALPGPEERRALWQSHLGQGHSLTQKELNQLAATVDFSGGHIRNAVLTAAVLAREHSRSIEYADLLQGILSECRKLGRQMPGDLRAAARDGSTS